MKFAICLISAMFAASAHAEWYYVTAIVDYNKITAHLAKGADGKKDITIRIANLENIEDIQDDRRKVLLSGSEPKELARQMFLKQVVWVDQLEVKNGENVAYVFPSYDQVLRVYTNRRLTGTYSVSAEMRDNVKKIYTRMLTDLNSEKPSTKADGNNASSGTAYENSYSKALFTYDALNWFKKKGQFLPDEVQSIYIGWVRSYQAANGLDAKALEIKISDMQKNSDLYIDFIFEEK